MDNRGAAWVALAPGDELRPDDLGPWHQVRLAHLRDWHVLRARCPGCGHVSLVYPAALRRRWPNHEALCRLESRLRCRLCGNRERNKLTVCRLPRNT